MSTFKDLCLKAQEILADYLRSPTERPQVDRSIVKTDALNKLVELFHGPEWKDANRGSTEDCHAFFTRQIPVPTLQRIIHHLHEHKIYQDPKDGPELDILLRLLVKSLNNNHEGLIPPENSYADSGVALIPVPLLMHTLMFLDSVKARHKLDDERLAQLLGDLKEVRPLPAEYKGSSPNIPATIQQAIELAADEIISSQNEVPSTGLASVEFLEKDKLVGLLSRHFAPRVDNGSPPNIPTVSIGKDSFHHEALELLFTLANTTALPGSDIGRIAEWHNVSCRMNENQKLEVKQLAIKGMKEVRDARMKMDSPGVSIIDNHETTVKGEVEPLKSLQFIHHDGSKANGREVTLQIGEHHYTAKQTCEAILRLLGVHSVDEAFNQSTKSGWGDATKDQGSKDQGKDFKDIETNAGAVPSKFAHVIPGCYVWSIYGDMTKCRVEVINAAGVIIRHPMKGRCALKWQHSTEKQRDCVANVITDRCDQ